MTFTVSASAPGKVLIVGGYLVLEDGVPGLVVSTSSRFNTSLSLRDKITFPYLHDKSLSESKLSSHALLNVISPQFHKSWEYLVPVEAPHVLLPLIRDVDGNLQCNPYVEFAVNTALCALSEDPSITKENTPSDYLSLSGHLSRLSKEGKYLEILLNADNEFYSQKHYLTSHGLPVSMENLKKVPKYEPCPIDPNSGKVIVNKTGLGSSAALVTSISAVVLKFFSNSLVPDSLSSEDHPIYGSKELVHTVAQVAHGLAQGKIGSGFDVCSATFGSILYSRISGKNLGIVMEEVGAAFMNPSNSQYFDAGTLLRTLRSGIVIESPHSKKLVSWNYSVKPFLLPPRVSLMLADVVGGSETPSMVRQVLQWREENPFSNPAIIEQACNEIIFQSLGNNNDAEQEQAMRSAFVRLEGPKLWRSIAAANARVSVLMARLSSVSINDPAAYDAVADMISNNKGTVDISTLLCPSLTPNTTEIVNLFSQLKDSLRICRELLRELGVQAAVPIEPASQTALANSCFQASGVIAAGVPGAGGFDALYTLIVDRSDSLGKKELEQIWMEWESGAITPLPLSEGLAMGLPGSGVCFC